MDDAARNLILAAEIAGLLHDLGKLRAEFAYETTDQPEAGNPDAVNWADRQDQCRSTTHVNSLHGAILENGRAYPPRQETGNEWLNDLKTHPEWARTLYLPIEWLGQEYSDEIQAHGLGDPLREHHGQRGFPEFTLLGTMFSLGADIRDSALDKSGSPRGSGLQRLDAAYIADAFGNEWRDRTYDPEALQQNWSMAAQIIQNHLFPADSSTPWRDLGNTRALFLPAIRPYFEQALGATLRPTNDVTLWHHAYSTASLHKIQVAEGVLRQNFQPWQDNMGLAAEDRCGLIRFRLLGIRWDWASLARTALEPVVFAALAIRRAEVIAAIRQRIEVDYPVGNRLYEDDDGVVFVVPGFYEGDSPDDRQRAETLFEGHILTPLTQGLLSDLTPLGAGVEIRLAWTQPRLYLTDYREVMPCMLQGCRERLLQIDADGLRQSWSPGPNQSLAVCPSCGLRPGQAAERGLGDSNLDSWRKGYCHSCAQLSVMDSSTNRIDGEARFNRASSLLGFRPITFNLHKLREQRGRGENPRLALISVQSDPLAIAEGAVLMTQVARPLRELPLDFLPENARSLTGMGEFFEHVNQRLLQGGVIPNLYGDDSDHARRLIGDKYWGTRRDGRIPQGNAQERGRKLIDEFFLREWVPEELISPEHPIGDRLALFAVRKHASPSRLARFWSDLDLAWREMLAGVAHSTEAYAAPLSLDVRGFRVIVAAADLRATLKAIRQETERRFERVQGRFPLDISVAVFREKFPFYLALDAVRRMEQRVTRRQTEAWTLMAKGEEQGHLHLTWDSGRGQPVNWSVPMTTADPQVRDLWYPYLICLSRPQGPGRLVHMADLEVGDQVQVRPMTFDYTVLEGSTRRYQIRYDQEGRRPHYILGDPGRRPYLLDQMEDLFDLAPATGWTASQSKAILGQLIDAYEQWVREVPDTLLDQGRAAWRGHAERLLLQKLPGTARQQIREALLAGLEQGLFFDTFDWSEFVEKGAMTQRGGALATTTGAQP